MILFIVKYQKIYGFYFRCFVKELDFYNFLFTCLCVYSLLYHQQSFEMLDTNQFPLLGKYYYSLCVFEFIVIETKHLRKLSTM